MKLGTLAAIFKAAREQDRKVEQYKRFVGEHLNYPMLQDLCNLVSYKGVTVRVGPLKTGEYIEISTAPQAQERTRASNRIQQESGVDWEDVMRKGMSG